MSLPKIKSRHLRAAEVENTGCGPEVYRDRVVIPMLGHGQEGSGYHPFTQRVYLHIAWNDLPWLMRLIWGAWWQHKKDMLQNLQWIENELGGSGVQKP